MDPRLESHRRALRMNTKLLGNCFAEVGDDLARRRLSEHTNNMAFLAMHLVDVRYFLSRYLGGDAESPFHALLDPIRSIDELREYPSLESILSAWGASLGVVDERMSTLGPEDVDHIREPQFPTGASRLDGITFLVEHESYHIGQLALLRRLLGLPAMSYA